MRYIKLKLPYSLAAIADGSIPQIAPYKYDTKNFYAIFLSDINVLSDIVFTVHKLCI